MSFTHPVARNWMELGTPKLPSHAIEYLKDRGVSREVWRRNNLRFLTPQETDQLWLGCEYEALLVPYGPHYATARLFDVPKSVGKFRSTMTAARLFEPVGTDWRKIRRDTDTDLVIAEGPIKALSAVSQDIRAVGIAGCWNWQKDRVALPLLRKYKWDGRLVTPVFDADITENNHVLLPYLLFGDWLAAQGARVSHLRLPKRKGGIVGLDDYLAANGREAFEQLKRHRWDSNAVEALRTSVMRTTEGGLASMFVMRYADDVRYDPQENEWFMWNGVLLRPQPRKPADVQEAMKETVRSIITDANVLKNDDRRASLIKWGARCDSNQVQRGALALASSDPRIRLDRSKLDADPYLLGTKNGIVDLRTGGLIEGHREQLITRAVATHFDPDAEAKVWKRFIKDVMCEDKELIRFIQRYCGYLLFGENPDRLIFFLYGVGRNGKSVFIETMRELMGDYALAAKAQLIMEGAAQRDSQSAEPFMLKLRGMRYVTASEVKEGMRIDPMIVKTFTGNDEMTVRGLHADPVQFTVAAKIAVRCNHRPLIDGADRAMWDRVVEIPFRLNLDKEEEDPQLRHKLREEFPGILAWAVRGYSHFQKDGSLKLPLLVQKTIEEYRYNMNSVSTWMDERTVRDPSHRSVHSALRNDYEKWCAANSKKRVVRPASRKEFNEHLTATGYERFPSNGVEYWLGVKLKGSK